MKPLLITSLTSSSSILAFDLIRTSDLGSSTVPMDLMDAKISFPEHSLNALL